MTDYKRSPKRINYCCVLNEGKFAAIEKVVVIPTQSLGFIISTDPFQNKQLFPTKVEVLFSRAARPDCQTFRKIVGTVCV